SLLESGVSVRPMRSKNVCDGEFQNELFAPFRHLRHLGCKKSNLDGKMSSFSHQMHNKSNADFHHINQWQ
ncbi:hypothetical protein J6590_107014, partial [Homalodisca vitripennis]